MKLVIVGAGSPYSPEILKELGQKKSRLPVTEIALVDIDPHRLFIMARFLNRYKHTVSLSDISLTSHEHWDSALPGADFVITQLRVGGNAARVLDERIPIKHGFIGQETTGPGGMMKALRTIPVVVDLARAMEALCPDAFLINYTNPSGMIAEALTKYANIRSVGLCAGGIRPAQEVASAAGCKESEVRYDYFGLNHMNVAYNLSVKGKPISDEMLLRTLKSREDEATPELLRALKMFPSSYMQYFFRTSKRLGEMQSAGKTRGERVLELEKTIYDAYADESKSDVPPELSLRGGGGYSEVAIGVLDSLYTNTDRFMICNVPNCGTVRCLPDDAVIETACLVNAAGIKPLPQSDFPKAIWGLVCSVKNYEQLAVEAAMTGERELLLLALAAHPLVRDVDRILPLLHELLEANKSYLPNFFDGNA